MALYRFTLRLIDYPAQELVKEVEVPDSELEGLSSIAREQCVLDYYKVWTAQQTGGRWEEIDNA